MSDKTLPAKTAKTRASRAAPTAPAPSASKPAAARKAAKPKSPASKAPAAAPSAPAKKTARRVASPPKAAKRASAANILGTAPAPEPQSPQGAPTPAVAKQAGWAAASAFLRARGMSQNGLHALGSATVATAKGALAAITVVGEAAVQAYQIKRAAQGAIAAATERGEQLMIDKAKSGLSKMRALSLGEASTPKGLGEEQAASPRAPSPGEAPTAP